MSLWSFSSLYSLIRLEDQRLACVAMRKVDTEIHRQVCCSACDLSSCVSFVEEKGKSER